MVKNCSWLIICICMLGGRSAVFAQDSEQITSVDPGSFIPELVTGSIPKDLPGHEPGERERPASQPTEEIPPREWFGQTPWSDWSRLTGDWGGFRTDLEDRGITFAGSFTIEFAQVFDGGINEGSSDRRLLDFNLSFDLESLVGLTGGTVFADFYSTAGDSLSADAGDFQTLSGIETENDLDQLAELWHEQWLFEKRFRVKVGKIDAYSEFGWVEAASEFLLSSAAMTPTVFFVLPGYPDPATAVNLFVYPTDSTYVGFGFFDGATAVDGVPTGSRGPKTFFDDSKSDDYFMIGEAGVGWDGGLLNQPGRAAGGVWYHTGTFERFDGGSDDGTTGFYALVEQTLWRPVDAGEDDSRGLTVFGQYGYADADVAEAEHHVAAGVVWTGFWPDRADDAAGFYASWADMSDEPNAAFDEDELTLELLYKFAATPFCSIKPVIQYVIHPYGDSTVDDALVGAVRVEITF